MLLFAFVLVFIVMVLGLSMDGLRAIKAGSLTAGALDGAALAAAKGMSEDNLSDDKVVQMAQDYFNANVKTSDPRGISFSPVEVTFDRATGQVDVSATASVETTFGRIFDVAHLDVTRKSQAIYEINEIELALMLDVTGSMKGQKLEDLKNAVSLAFDILLKTGAAPTRIALAPYAATVNAGDFANGATDSASVDGCVFEREGINSDTDEAPGPGDFLGSEPKPGDPSNHKYSCPDAKILPLTSERQVLDDAIDDLSAGGWTAGHLGTAWAWYLISDEWQSIWPVGSRPKAYGTKDLTKAVILMTDGEFNTSYANGPVNATSNDQTKALCTAMKDKGVWVFTVGFQLKQTKAINLLRDCATNADEGDFQQAENAEELERAYQRIAQKLINLRISQ